MTNSKFQYSAPRTLRRVVVVEGAFCGSDIEFKDAKVDVQVDQWETVDNRVTFD